jgi:hypothetical protein
MPHVQTYLAGDYQSKNDEYYELIAKYDDFTQGWDDPDPNMIDSNYAPNPIPFGYMYRDVPGTDDDAHYRAYAIDSIVTIGTVVTDTLWRYYHNNNKKTPFLHGRSQSQLDNMSLRTDANNMGDRILWAFYAMMINRIASSVDAVLAANAYNRKITGGSLTMLDKVRLEPLRIGQTDLTANGVMVRYPF